MRSECVVRRCSGRTHVKGDDAKTKGRPKLRQTLHSDPLLLAEVERLDDCAVALDVNLLEVLQQLAAFTYQTQQCALRA